MSRRTPISIPPLRSSRVSRGARLGVAAALLLGAAACARQEPEGARFSGGATPSPVAHATPAASAPPAAAGTDTLIHVHRPTPGARVTSPLVVSGEARGSWYFEADFPVRLLDAAGRELAVKPARARGEWMTTAFVPFEDTLRFTAPATATGVLVFEKSNPSDLPEHAAEVRIPVRFR